jgi:hypothetical protein
MQRRAQTMIDFTWTKSSYSLANGNCVEVAGLSSNLVQIRDSKNPQGTVLSFTPTEWTAFVGGVRGGEFECGPGHSG